MNIYSEELMIQTSWIQTLLTKGASAENIGIYALLVRELQINATHKIAAENLDFFARCWAVPEISAMLLWFCELDLLQTDGNEFWIDEMLALSEVRRRASLSRFDGLRTGNSEATEGN